MDLRSLKKNGLWILLFGGTIMSCNNDWSASTHSSEEQLMRSSSDLRSEPKNYSPERKSLIKARISENLVFIRKEIQFLEKETRNNTKKINAFGHTRSEQLRSDLVRIEKDLRTKLEDLDNSFWQDLSSSMDSFDSDIGHIEDELEQIDEQVDEWYENNVK